MSPVHSLMNVPNCNPNKCSFLHCDSLPGRFGSAISISNVIFAWSVNTLQMYRQLLDGRVITLYVHTRMKGRLSFSHRIILINFSPTLKYRILPYMDKAILRYVILIELNGQCLQSALGYVRLMVYEPRVIDDMRWSN